MNTKGITLVEVLLYLAIFSILIVALISFSTRISLSQVKTHSLEEIQQQSRYVMERLKVDFYNTASIDSGSTEDYLLLAEGDYYELIDGQVLRSGISLTSDKVEVTNFEFTYMTTEAIYPSIKVDLTIRDPSYGQRQEYNNELTLSTVLTLRQ